MRVQGFLNIPLSVLLGRGPTRTLDLKLESYLIPENRWNISQHLVLRQQSMAAMFNSNPIASSEVGSRQTGPRQGPHLTSSSKRVGELD